MLVWLTAFIYTKTIRGKHKEALGKATFVMFSWMQVFTACAFAFSHGSNDIANAVGPFVAIMDVIKNNAVEAQATVPAPVMLTFGVSLIVGLWFIGKEVIQTVGTNLTEMHPASGFQQSLQQLQLSWVLLAWAFLFQVRTFWWVLCLVLVW